MALSNATGLGAGAGVPAGLVAGAAPSGADAAAAFPAFDDMFSQLTGALLTTVAAVGAAATTCAAHPVADAGVVTDSAETALVGAVPAPVALALPVVVAAPMPTDGSGAGLDGVIADEAGASTTPAATAGERMAGAVAHGRRGGPRAAPPAANSFTGPMTPATRAGSAPVGATAADGARLAESGPTLATPPGATPRDVTPATVSVAGSMPTVGSRATVESGATEAQGTDTAGVAIVALPSDAAGAKTPATEVRAHAQGLDRRRGMRETPTPARTLDGTAPAAALTELVTTDAVPASPSPATPSPALPDAAPATPLEGTANAERMFALQRALARQTASGHRDTPAPGLVAQVLGGAGGHADQGADAGADGQAPSRRQGRPGVSPLQVNTPPAVAGAANAAAVASMASMATDPATVPGPAAGAAWRAALASSTAAAQTLTAASPLAAPSGAMSAAPAHLAAVLAPAVAWPMPRDRAPLVVDLPLPSADLDAATAQSVHGQIVKSIRMQWTGGLGEARVTLRPDYLGEVVATIKVDQGVVTATLQADTPEVRRWMESHTATLRDALVEQGLKLDRLTVGEPEREQAQHQRQGRPRPRQQDTRRPRTPREAAAPDTPFEVTTE